MTPCASRHRRLSGLLLAVVGSTALVSGFAWPLGRWDWSLWPWNRAWYMFSANDGRHYALAFFGHLEDGQVVRVDMRRWFHVQPGFESFRYNYLPRADGALRAVAGYVCRRYNEALGAGPRMVRISVVDYSWPQKRGQRGRLAEVPLTAISAWAYLGGEACQGEGPR